MKKSFFIFSLYYFFLLTLLHQALPGPDDPVNIPDAALRAALETKLGKSSGDTITEAEMNGITGSFSAQNKGIADLTGLEHATGITSLSLDTNRNIADLSPLEDLTQLTALHLNTNKIVDLSPLAGLTALTRLSLNSNQITDISSLRNLTNLTYLRLSGNRELSNISIVKRLTKLESLWLGLTKITHEGLSEVLPFLSALEDLNIQVTPITDLSVLQNLPSSVRLEKLDLRLMGPYAERGWHLKDVTPLVSLLNDGVLSTVTRELILIYNWRLDYESHYTDIPALKTGTAGFLYSDRLTPKLERVSVEDYVGTPGTAHTFVVKASNITVLNIQGTDYNFTNPVYEKVPVTFTVTAPDGSETRVQKLTGPRGLASVTVILGNHEERHTVDAVVAANAPTNGPQHAELKVSFTATADDNAPLPPGLTVTFEDYPETPPTDEFTLTIKFSEPVTGLEKEDITVETDLTTGTGTATLEDLTPTTGGFSETEDIAGTLAGQIPAIAPAQTYTARIALPPQAKGTVRLIVRGLAVFSLTREKIGPTADTASDPIEFGEKRGPSVFPSYVAMDKVIFNEFRNVENDTHDWIELKNISDEGISLKDWEVSMVASEGEHRDTDRDIVGFPDTTLPPGGVLLIVNTDPSENDLIHGQNLENPHHNPNLYPQYLIRPEMKLPDTPYLLILRSARDKNGKWEGFEDLVGDYHRDDVGYRTQIWPLRDTWVYTGTGARFWEAEVYQRVMRPKGAVPMKPMERGYFHDAWVVSDYQSGLGYDLGTSSETGLGTPGYATKMENDIGTGQISISEVMFATNERGSPSQWIELYNNSATEIVDLKGWRLRIEVRDSQPVHRHLTFVFKSLEVMPNQAVLVVARHDRHSPNILERRIYDVQRQNRKALLLRSEGFALRLFSPDGTLVDMAGNLDGKMGQDKPRWELPSGWKESGGRSSLIRRYEDRVPARGTLLRNWVRAADTALLVGYSYWGFPTDDGTPGYRRGSPLPVTLSSLRADLSNGSVVVKWTTASEMENAGFHVLRSRDKGSGFVRVSPALIPGAGTTAEGQTYTYRDTTASENVPYYYRLEEVSLSGERRAVATVRLRGHLSAVNRMLWMWADVKSED